MSNLSVVGFVVRGKDGQVDRLASAQKFSKALVEFVSSTAAQDAVISEAVSAVFDAHRGEYVPTQFLLASVRTLLGTTQQDFSKTNKAILDYVSRQAKAGVLKSRRGQSGGFIRVADLTTEETATEQA